MSYLSTNVSAYILDLSNSDVPIVIFVISIIYHLLSNFSSVIDPQYRLHLIIDPAFNNVNDRKPIFIKRITSKLNSAY